MKNAPVFSLFFMLEYRGEIIYKKMFTPWNA